MVDQSDDPAMSEVHKEEFERIKREYDTVVILLSYHRKAPQKAKSNQNDSFLKLPSFDPDVLESAVAAANDAYALLLMARSEGYLRAYLDSMQIALGVETKLSVLIDKCRKEFNKSNPKIPIRANIAQEVHDLRIQRNEYAHGNGSSVFPPISSIVVTLGRFFHSLP